MSESHLARDTVNGTVYLESHSQPAPVWPVLADEQPRVAIVGGGWFGCHLACSLLQSGVDVTIYEQHDRLLTEASFNNQNRLHQGFHYARCHFTRTECKLGFDLFMKRYKDLTLPVGSNLYGVATDSILDAPTYMDIMRASGLQFD